MKILTVPLATLLAVLCLGLSACDTSRSTAESAVRANLKDPESARFGGFYHNHQNGRACLTVNAKNSMGGYTGDKQIHLKKQDGDWLWIEESDSDLETCRTSWADQPNV